ncbi:uncharacterized protein RCC_03884 [Ramularia collo-cygni]|uniref:GST N-terminal domain-containing protein n=1 Tax=Ramularia collo-cygni TaxID=112498 RepID=A0A2D3V3D7_9PEZI|nr:uncharacterized protein RCC_03884 [Ramularia collo-cygni]CZT18046.1 uncharacterized protein RCC_03884 [Ramularia collo-cygni]
MGSTSNAPVILFGYPFSPYVQKISLLLHLTEVPFEFQEVGPLIPRPELESIGITYRRVPILAVGKDIYCDSKVQQRVILEKLAKKKIPTSIADRAWEEWGFVVFDQTLGLAPGKVMTPEFQKDRGSIYPLLIRPDFDTLRESAIADLYSRLDYLENTVLEKTMYIGGDEITLATVHAIWGIRWDLHGIEDQPPGLGEKHQAVGRERFPKVWRLIDSLPLPDLHKISFEEAKEKIFQSDYTSDVKGLLKDEPTEIPIGTPVTADNLGSDPRKHSVHGKLQATDGYEFVLDVPTGLRIHFPRESVILRRA